MCLLRAGITGFDITAEVPVAKFKHAVYVAAQFATAKVGETRPADGVTPNFHQIDIDYGEQSFVVLCNRHFPIVAFADQVGGMQVERFLKIPVDFAESLATCGFEVADFNELNRRVTSTDLEALSTTEQHQAKYWKPQRVGDIVFNFWD